MDEPSFAPTWGYAPDGRAELFALPIGAKLPEGWSDKPPRGRHPHDREAGIQPVPVAELVARAKAEADKVAKAEADKAEADKAAAKADRADARAGAKADAEADAKADAADDKADAKADAAEARAEAKAEAAAHQQSRYRR